MSFLFRFLRCPRRFIPRFNIIIIIRPLGLSLPPQEEALTLS